MGTPINQQLRNQRRNIITALNGLKKFNIMDESETIKILNMQTNITNIKKDTDNIFMAAEGRDATAQEIKRVKDTTINDMKHLNAVLKRFKINKKLLKRKITFDDIYDNTRLYNIGESELIYREIIGQDILKLVKDALRQNRTVSNDTRVIIQHPLFNVQETTEFTELENNWMIYAQKKYFRPFIEGFRTTLYADGTVEDSANIKYFIAYEQDILEDDGTITKGITYRWNEQIQFFHKETPWNNPEKIKNQLEPIIDFKQSEPVPHFLIGFKILYNNVIKQSLTTQQTLNNLRAYNGTDNNKFHTLTCKSTSSSKICIYETYLHILEREDLKFSRYTKNNIEYIKNLLSAEGKEIEAAVKNGELIKALELLTTKYNNEIFIMFYNKNPDIEYTTETHHRIGYNNNPIIINNGITKQLEQNEIREYEKKYMNKKVFLYEKGYHVAPTILKSRFFKKDDKNKMKQLENKSKTYGLKQKRVKTMKKIEATYGYDLETYKNGFNESIPYCACLYSKNDKKAFYGERCVMDLAEYIYSISTPMNESKTRKKQSVPKIYIYGFNNSRFDNLLIFDEIHRLDNKTKFVFASNSIKIMKFRNISIFDISLQYKIGGLRETCKEFELEEEKGVFPYKFVNAYNLEYIGDVPDLEYWNKPEDMEEYIKNTGSIFNMKEYTIKYCMLDSKLVYELALIHHENCTGTINGRQYDVLNSPTSAGLAVKMFQQCFQNETLYQSPDKVIKKERLAYKGGRTEVFKREFRFDIVKKHLLYYDINSAHPSGMQKPMPYKYQYTMEYDDKKISINDIIDYNLYKARTVYKGNVECYIPNILHRTEKGNIIAVRNCPISYQWGMELKEAILDGCEVYIEEELFYEGKTIFKEFAEYFYNERLKIKKTNKAKSLFYKNVINSFYGKFGQKLFNSSAYVNSADDMMEILKGDMTIMTDFEVVNDKLLFSYKNEDLKNQNIGNLTRFASYIAMTTRCKLAEFKRDVGHENVYYCDTDSVFTTQEPSEKFKSQDVLGLWKIEEVKVNGVKKPAIINHAVFLAPKVYYYKTIDGYDGKASKGVRSDDIEPEEYIQLSNGEIDYIAKSNDMFFRSYSGVKITETTRRLKTVYNKRNWTGNDSEPFMNIEEWSDYQKENN